MATIKSYTDIEQSKKLAEILPIESADMYYSPVPVREWKDKEDTSKGTQVVFKDYIFALENLPNSQIGEGDTYAWSLAALLSVLPTIRKGEDTANPFIAKTPDGEYYIVYATLTKEIDGSAIYNNPIDACCEIIIRFNKLKML